MALELSVALDRLVHAVMILLEHHRRIWLLHPDAACLLRSLDCVRAR